jgi:hypothetical protein
MLNYDQRYRRRNLQEELRDEAYQDLRWWFDGDDVMLEVGQPVEGDSICPEGSTVRILPSRGCFERKTSLEEGVANQLPSAKLLTQDIMIKLPAGGSPSEDRDSKASSTADTSQVDQPRPEGLNRRDRRVSFEIMEQWCATLLQIVKRNFRRE